MKISAVIITYNEEERIADAITSVTFADEILVVDSYSNDSTVKIARQLGAKIIQRDWPGFSAQKQFGVDSAENNWIFSLDADEVACEELQNEIITIASSLPSADGYRIPRLSTYMGREIRHSGWYPDLQLRLFDRTKGQWNGHEIHESVKMSHNSVVAVLKGCLRHFSVESAEHHHRMIGERYAPLAAKQMYDRGRRTSPLGVALAGPAAFFRSYILKLGILDGFPGFCIARFAAHHAYLKHLILWELMNIDYET